ncbi:MAG: GxxExxY protein [Isosphaerales bacterium]
MREDELNVLSHAIIGSAFNVSNALGTGFLEKVYENALAHELRKRGLFVQQQEPIRVYYDSVVVGKYAPDLLVEQTVIVEIKAAKERNEVFFAQCLNYLKATGLPLCLLLNFGNPEVGVSRLRSPSA